MSSPSKNSSWPRTKAPASWRATWKASSKSTGSPALRETAVVSTPSWRRWRSKSAMSALASWVSRSRLAWRDSDRLSPVRSTASRACWACWALAAAASIGDWAGGAVRGFSPLSFSPGWLLLKWSLPPRNMESRMASMSFFMGQNPFHYKGVRKKFNSRGRRCHRAAGPPGWPGGFPRRFGRGQRRPAPRQRSGKSRTPRLPPG